MSVSAAKSRVMQAQTLIESRRYDDVEAVVETGLGFLVGLPESEVAEISGQLVALRAEAAELALAEKYGAKIRAAERELKTAREDIEKGYILPSGIDFRFDKAAEYLDGVPDTVKAPLLDEAEMLRTILAARSGGTPAADTAQPTQAAPVLSMDEQAALSKARGRITQVRSLVESRSSEGSEVLLDEAAELLAAVHEAERTPLLADIETLRGEIVRVDREEYARKIERQLSPHFHAAENVQKWDPAPSARALERMAEILAEERTAGKLSAEVLEEYEQRVAAARTERTRLLKENALERGLPLLADFEEKAGQDPFLGLDDSAAYRLTSELDTLRYRAMHEMHEQPDDDPDKVAFLGRIAAVDARIEASSQAWGLAKLHERVRRSWQIVHESEEIAGWQEEQGNPEPRLLETPNLPRTRTAIMRIGYLLGDADTVKLRAEHPDDEVVRETFRAAEQELAAATEQLSRAYHAVLAKAEQEPAPLRGDDQHLPLHYRSAIETSFAGTPALDGLLERVEALEERWKAEVAAIMAARQDLYDRLAAQADQTWPAIVSSCGADTDFDPGSTPAGTVVHLSGVYNRSGWDFQNYDFCMRWDGVPVGGSYEPYVQQALEHAWYELKLDVNDRITWDLVAVVQGGGKIGERTKVSVRGSNGLEIGTVEEWPAVECVRLKIIALHAGPVAVGPDHAWEPTA